MWPKVIAQLFDILPHVSRLLPLADRFFQSKSASEEANRKAFDALTENLRNDLGQITASHTGLYRQLNEQSEKLSTLTVDLGSLKNSTEAADLRLARVERQLSTGVRLLIVTLLLNVVLLALIVFLLVHH